MITGSPGFPLKLLCLVFEKVHILESFSIVGILSKITSGALFHIPVDRIIKAVNVHTTKVSINGSIPATNPSRTGSFVFTAECAIAEDP